jgi:hypothetical protein
METREIYKQKYEAQLKEWGARLDVLNAEAHKATAQAKLDMAPRIEAVKTTYEAAKAGLTKVGHATDDKWEALKHDADKAWTDAKSSVEGAFEAMKHPHARKS